jgi:hypothetical protein
MFFRARGIYTDSDIFIFDDSLSAVDGTVANNIVQKLVYFSIYVIEKKT